MRLRAKFTLVPVLFCAAGCGSLPRDPEHTLERVMHERRMRVGLVENAPWVVRTGAAVRLIAGTAG